MKVLLNPTRQFLKFPELTKLLKKRLYPYNRMYEAVKWIENNAIDQFTNPNLILKLSTSFPDRIIHFYSDDTMDDYAINGHIFHIVEVDTSEPWTIEIDEYGEESILYLDTIEEDINFYGCEPSIEGELRE